MKANISRSQLIQGRKKTGLMLKQLREAKGMSQTEFSEYTGVNQATISKIEAGKWNYGIDTITLILHYLDSEIIFK